MYTYSLFPLEVLICLFQISSVFSIFFFTLDMTYLIYNHKGDYHPPADYSKIYLNSVDLFHAILNAILSI